MPKQITDDNFKTYNSFFNVNGKINSRLLLNIDEIKKLKIYEEVLNKTSELDVFDGITFSQRLVFLHDNMTLQYCPHCKKPYIFFASQRKSFRLCRHHIISDVGLEKIRKNKNYCKKTLINEITTNPKLLLNNKQFNEFLEKTNRNNIKNYNFVITKDNFQFYHDVVVKTLNLIPFNEKKLQLGKRIFFIKNNINEIPKCKFCGKNERKYVNSVVGFLDNCCDCSNKKYIETLSNKYTENITSKIDLQKYEIVTLPNRLNYDPLVVRCKKCGKITENYIKNGALKFLEKLKLCKFCENNFSKAETEIVNFIKSFNLKILHKNGTRKIIPPKEIDIYIPEKKIGIEFDGLYWHSENSLKCSRYHLDKTIACEKQGIQLIHIFENEWLAKQDIVKSRLKNLLGIYDKTIFARKCEVQVVDSKTSKAFQNNNHIYGAVNASVNIGLYCNNQLVSLMTFGKCRFDKKHEWEMLRFCSKLGYHIPGGAGKLLKYFERNYNPKSLVSYADRRWSTGKLYKALDFKLDHVSAPNYWYWKNNYTLFSRNKFQKHKLPKLLDMYDPNKTEIQNMSDNGYKRIFDCGNLVFIKIYQTV